MNISRPFFQRAADFNINTVATCTAEPAKTSQFGLELRSSGIRSPLGSCCHQSIAPPHPLTPPALFTYQHFSC